MAITVIMSGDRMVVTNFDCNSRKKMKTIAASKMAASNIFNFFFMNFNRNSVNQRLNLALKSLQIGIETIPLCNGFKAKFILPRSRTCEEKKKFSLPNTIPRQRPKPKRSTECGLSPTST